MIKATKEFLEQTDALFENRKQEILNTKDEIKITGSAFYVANDGDDSNDGKSIDTPWKTIEKVNEAELSPGDGVFFKRGDIFRGSVKASTGVTYAAYGQGDKPKLYSGPQNLADKELWELYDKEHNIWKLKIELRDAGALVFDDGKAHTRKMIPSFKNGNFVHRNNPDIIFDMARDLNEDLDLYWLYKGEFSEDEEPLILYTPESLGEVYLRCDKGNPAEVFSSIEALLRINGIRLPGTNDVTIDNLCIKYVGAHGIGGGTLIKGLTVTNCEFGWIGGSIQHFNTNAKDPARRGIITRFGNAIEIWGLCENYKANNNYIYEVYDAGITHQFRVTSKSMMENIEYKDNLIEKCVYGIEYFLDQSEDETESRIRNCVMENNFIRFSGYGWGRQRYNPDTPAAIKSWNHTNMAENFVIKNNIFDRGTYNFLHLCAITDEHCPTVDNNTYIQILGDPLGRFGGYSNTNPPIHKFDMDAEQKINNIFGDKNAKVYYIV